MLHLPSQPGSPQLEIRRPPKTTKEVKITPNLRPGKTREKTRRSDLEQHRAGDVPPLPKLLADGLPQFHERCIGEVWLADASAEVREILPITGKLEPLLVDKTKAEASLVLPVPPVPPVPPLPPAAQAAASEAQSSAPPAPEPEPSEPEPSEPTKARRVGVVSVANAVAASGTHNVLLGLRDFFDRPALAGSKLIGIRNLAKVHEFDIDDRFNYFLNQARPQPAWGLEGGGVGPAEVVTGRQRPSADHPHPLEQHVAETGQASASLGVFLRRPSE